MPSNDNIGGWNRLYTNEAHLYYGACDQLPDARLQLSLRRDAVTFTVIKKNNRCITITIPAG